MSDVTHTHTHTHTHTQMQTLTVGALRITENTLSAHSVNFIS